MLILDGNAKDDDDDNEDNDDNGDDNALMVMMMTIYQRVASNDVNCQAPEMHEARHLDK